MIVVLIDILVYIVSMMYNSKIQIQTKMYKRTPHQAKWQSLKKQKNVTDSQPCAMHQAHTIQTCSDKMHNHMLESTTPSSLIVPIKSKMLKNLVSMLLKVLIYRSGEHDPSSLPEIPGMLFLGTQQGWG